jgi:hypothetical protein
LSVSHSIQTGFEAHPVSYPVGTGECFSKGGKRDERDAGHSLPSNAEVKINGAILPLPHTSS